MAKVFQQLLLATERTPFDTGAENLALTLAQRRELPLHCVLPLVSNPEYESLAPAIAAHAEQEMAAKLAVLRTDAQRRNVAFDAQVRRGPEPYEEILAEAAERRSDLIVLRRRGKRSFLANLLLGEMVTKVLAHARCSVLIVPREARIWQQRVLVAAEATPRGQRIVQVATELAAECALPLSVLCVAASDEPAQRQAPQQFVDACGASSRALGVSAEGLVRHGKPHQEILQAARDRGADLIVIGSHGETHPERAWIGGVAQKVIGLTETAVLVVHTNEK